MFAPLGLFRAIACPYFAHGLCDRPHCQLSHEVPKRKRKAHKDADPGVKKPRVDSKHEDPPSSPPPDTGNLPFHLHEAPSVVIPESEPLPPRTKPPPALQQKPQPDTQRPKPPTTKPSAKTQERPNSSGGVQRARTPSVSSVSSGGDASRRSSVDLSVAKEPRVPHTARTQKPPTPIDLTKDLVKSARVPHAPKTTSATPRIGFDPKVKVPMAARQKCMDKLCEEYLRIWEGQAAEAHHEATERETAIARKVQSQPAYLGAIRTLLNELKARPVMSQAPAHNKPTHYGDLLPLILTDAQLQANNYPLLTPDIDTSPAADKLATMVQRVCVRCRHTYTVGAEATCTFHPGKAMRLRGDHSKDKRRGHSCCSGEVGSLGCTTNTFHVCERPPDDFSGFVETVPRRADAKPPACRVYGLDCEMCYTEDGAELTRVTVVDEWDECVYDQLVLPEKPILDYNTKFSGLTADMMRGVSTCLADVQAHLLTFIHSDTILIGHSLESDLRALKVSHPTVIDSSILYPHPVGHPVKYGLQALVREHLGRFIQQQTAVGHDSKEDALGALHLALHYVKKRKPKV